MILDRDFSLNRYGLHVRLVNEDDAEYILNLRTDHKLGRFLSKTVNDLEVQKQWIRDYKKREALGLEYYFIYLHQGERIGVNRIYNINFSEKSATAGSWICSPNLSFELPLYTVVLFREIFFDLLELEIDFFDTRKENKKVIRMHNILGAHKIGENDLDIFHTLTKQDFMLNKPKFLKYIDTSTS